MRDHGFNQQIEEVVANATNSKQIDRLDFYFGPIGATVPMLFFVIWAITTSILKISTETGLIMGMLFGLALGMFMSKSPWADYAQGIFDGMSQSIGVVAIVAWFWAGMFAEILKTGGLVEGLVWLGTTTGVHGGWFVAITFFLAAIFSSAVGTGYGTVVAFTTLLYPAGILLNADPVFLFAAILSGAAFGDNLAPVSDTTIVSAVTQDADVPGVVRSRFKYSVMAGIPAFILFAIFGSGNGVIQTNGISALNITVSPNGLLLLIPFTLVIVLALSGRHLITSLTWGIITATVIIPLAGLGSLSQILDFNFEKKSIEGALVNGFTGYMNMAILILLIVAASHIMSLGGTMEAMKEALNKKINGVIRRAELAIVSIVTVLNVFITINTAAEIAAAPFVRQIGEQFKIHPYRRANLLDAITSALGYIFPWSAAVLLGWSTISNLHEKYDWVTVVDPATVFPFVFHGWFLVFIMFFAAFTGWGLRLIGKNGEEVKPK
ncbi:MAG: Na+/H+ antiporter NhaC family protein [Tepidibacillus sp.]